jgi:hypothetical protein
MQSETAKLVAFRMYFNMHPRSAIVGCQENEQNIFARRGMVEIT